MQWYVFGKLRVAGWQRLWDRLLNYSMGQLVILGAVVEPDVGELLLWTAFSAAVGVLSVSSGLCRDRLEYMCHLPTRASAWSYARVIGLQVALGGGALGLACGVTALLRDAGAFTALGMSNYHASEVARCFDLCEEHGFAKPTVYQGLYNPLNRAVEDELLPLLKANGCAFIAYNPLAAGLLTGAHESVDVVAEGRFKVNSISE